MTVFGMEYFGQFRAALQVVSPLNILSTLGLLSGMTVWGKGKALFLYKYCSKITKIPVAYQECFRHILKPQKPMGSYEKIITTSEPNLAYKPSLQPGLSFYIEKINSCKYTACILL